MVKLSVVIITKNEAHIIADTLQSITGITDNIVIVDNGSTDDTIDICRQFNAHVISTDWKGYGETKNIGIDAAKYDWILGIDADEVIDEELKNAILQIDFSEEKNIFEMKFKNFFCNKWIRFGEWSGDKHIRLFNRKYVRWNNAAVHENLVFPVDAKKVALKGNILHYTTNSFDEHIEKTIRYAKQNAEKYFKQGKKASAVKLYISPCFTFVKYYIFKLGFLDGWYGFLIAKNTAWYTYLKYKFLKEISIKQNNQ